MIGMTILHQLSGRPRRFAIPAAALITAIMSIQTGWTQTATPAAKSALSGAPTRYHSSRFPGRAAAYYSVVWGVDSLGVKAVESGELIRFSYRVLDPIKAKELNDKNIEASLILPEAHASLVIPSLEKVGKLRQSSTPEAGKAYWMAFSNPSRLVKRGDRVNVVIGSFHADGLVVE